MGDWADEKASSVTDEWWDDLKAWNQLDTPAGDFDHIYWETLEKLIAAALRQAAAQGRADQRNEDYAIQLELENKLAELEKRQAAPPSP